MAKSKYETHVQPRLSVIEVWARDGLTLDQIAHNLGIALSTLCLYKERESELSESLKRGKDDADAEVENALFRSALGYRYTEQVATPSGIVVEVERFEKPNITAQIFWLKNRRPNDWRDKQEVGVTGQVTHTNEKKTHVIHELISDPSVAERVKQSFRRGLIPSSGSE